METILSLFGSCLPCFPDLSNPVIKIKGNKYKIVKLLGEGGFSYVYLVTQGNSQASYALKKIRCPYGGNDESYKQGLKEIRNYHRFTASQTPYIIQSIDEVIINEVDGSRTIYILLPYFEKSLQDIINNLVLDNQSMPESTILKIFVGICRGLKVMHGFKQTQVNHVDQEEEDDALLPLSEDEDQPTINSVNDTELYELCPYAYRDLKPANIMISTEGLPVIVDLGSTSKARLSIKNRQQALTLTDFASEHCSLPYRAPELLDVITGSEITEKTDIWSLGCLLYCCCFQFSPFEKLEIDQGANLNVAISQGKYIIPGDHQYSSELIQIIHDCLQLDPEKRPQVDDLIDRTLELSRQQNF